MKAYNKLKEYLSLEDKAKSITHFSRLYDLLKKILERFGADAYAIITKPPKAGK